MQKEAANQVDHKLNHDDTKHIIYATLLKQEMHKRLAEPQQLLANHKVKSCFLTLATGQTATRGARCTKVYTQKYYLLCP